MRVRSISCSKKTTDCVTVGMIARTLGRSLQRVPSERLNSGKRQYSRFFFTGLVSFPSLKISTRFAPFAPMPFATPTSGFESGGW